MATNSSQNVPAYYLEFLRLGRIFWFVRGDILWRGGLFEIYVSLATPGSTCQGVGSRRVLLGRTPEKDKGEGEQEEASVLRH